MNFDLLPAADITYLDELLLDGQGLLRVVPYAALAAVPQDHLSLFCVRHGLYCIPTQELIDWLRQEVAGAKALEVGAGNGVIGRALGITATDSKVQAGGLMRAALDLAQQAPVQYGPDVLTYDAIAAVRRFKPHTAIAAWVTHRWNPAEAWREGFMYGVDEKKLLAKVARYIFIGNEGTHGKKPVLDLPHKSFKAPWLLSRSLRRDENVIWIWEGSGV